MFKRLLVSLVFLLGLAVVAWVGIGYLGSNPLGAAVAALIAVAYVAGAVELYRFRQATAALARSVDALSAPPASLGDWLATLPLSLRHPVRLRVDGERAALPAPALAPYLVGLLVLLGMLGTLLGMMATLRGTGIALESATDLQAIRGSLAAPVKGLGFAFGTSIAGVAASAMLGLMSALCRRERLHVLQTLDARIGTTLRVHSQAWRREEGFRLMQQQAAAMPALVDRMQAMIDAMERQAAAAAERQAAAQQAMHATTEAAFGRLVASVEQAVSESVAGSARAAGAALQPVVESVMAGLARDTSALHERVAQAVQQQLDGMSSGWEASTQRVAGLWTDAVAEQRVLNQALVSDLRATHASLADTIGTSQQQAASHLRETADGALRDIRDANTSLATTITQAHGTLLDGLDASHGALTQRLDASLHGFTHTFQQQAGALVDAVGDRLDRTAAHTADAWTTAIAAQQSSHERIAAQNEQALAAAATALQQNGAGLIGALHDAQARLQSALAERDEARLAAWTDTLQAMATTLSAQWEQSTEDTVQRQQAISETLAQTAQDITRHTQQHASETIAEMSRLVEAASEAPKAAAEVVAEMREKLSESMVRDTAMLDERARLLSTLETLLDAVNHASTEQRTAVDALVATSAHLLESVGARFAERVELETGKLDTAAERIADSAAHVAGLGESLGAAVQSFGQANEALMERLQVIADALDRSLVRSDEQLAYYVAQAREVVDLSVLSQKQILEDLQHVARQRKAAKA
jgi:hypothetical protein